MTNNVVMVTGAAGFIGSHLTEALLSRGVEVHALDLVPLQRSENLSPFRSHSGLIYTEGDIRDRNVIERFFRPEANRLFHLASIVGVRHYMEDPLALIDIAILGTRSLLGLCIEHDVRMLFTSTSEIYGKNPAVPWTEDADRVLGPTSIDRWSYSSTKAVIEHMLFGAHRKHDWPFSIVRFFNVYGPRQNPIYVVSQSIKRVLRGESPEIYDGGNQTRCFTYIGDVINGILSASERPEAIGHVFNLGNDVETKISEVVRMVVEEAGSSLPIRDIDTKAKYGQTYEDIPRRIPDAGKIKRVLGWEPKTLIREGISKTIKWAKENPWYID